MSFEERVEQDVLRFQEEVGLHPGADLQMILLKGHLLIEEQLQAFIDSHVTDPDHLSQARLTFHQRLILARAFHPAPDTFGYFWVWDAARLLNTLRNKMVHNLAPQGFVEQLKSFTDLVEQHIPRPITPGSGTEYETARFGVSISVLNLCLSRLTKVVAHRAGA